MVSTSTYPSLPLLTARMRQDWIEDYLKERSSLNTGNSSLPVFMGTELIDRK